MNRDFFQNQKTKNRISIPGGSTDTDDLTPAPANIPGPMNTPTNIPAPGQRSEKRATRRKGLTVQLEKNWNRLIEAGYPEVKTMFGRRFLIDELGVIYQREPTLPPDRDEINLMVSALTTEPFRIVPVRKLPTRARSAYDLKHLLRRKGLLTDYAGNGAAIMAFAELGIGLCWISCRPLNMKVSCSTLWIESIEAIRGRYVPDQKPIQGNG